MTPEQAAQSQDAFHSWWHESGKAKEDWRERLIANAPAEEQAALREALKSPACGECETAMVEVGEFLFCSKPACSMYGREVRRDAD